MKNHPSNISVVIPLYNHEMYIEEAIQSVIDQTRPVDELIIVDDGSRDNSLSKARRAVRGFHKAQVLTQSNAGAHVALNRAIQSTESKFVAVLNSDDVFKPEKIQRSLECFLSTPKLELLFGKIDLIDEKSNPVRSGVTYEWLKRSWEFFEYSKNLPLSLYYENFAATTSNFVFRKSLWERVGGFQSLRYCHDLDFLFASMKKEAVLFDKDFVHIGYRVHPSNTIKENIDNIRSEIACVLTDAIFTSALGDPNVSLEQASMLKFAIESKNNSSMLVYLLTQRSSFTDRSEFYNSMLSMGNDTLKLQASDSQIEPNHQDSLPKNEALIKSARRQGRSHLGPILMELARFDRGGLEKVVLDTSVVLRSYGVEVVIVSCGPVGHLGEFALESGIAVYQLPETGIDLFYADVLRKHDIKLAMSHFSRVGYPIFRKAGIPNITFIHNVYAMLTGDALANFIDDDRFVSKYISVSDNATDYAVSRLGIDRRKIATVPNGLIIEEHQNRISTVKPHSREDFGFSQGDYVFLNVASYNLHKNHYLMLAALKLALLKSEKIRILCIGNTIYPPHIDQLRADIESAELTHHMVMPGSVDDVTPYLMMADAFMLPSLIEGWSIAMNEAMFAAKPVILTDTGGAQEVIDQDDIGILIPNEYGVTANLDSTLLDEIGYNRRQFRTASYLASAMLRMSNNRDHWRRAGEKGRQKIIQRYDFSMMIEAYLAIIEQMTSGTDSKDAL